MNTNPTHRSRLKFFWLFALVIIGAVAAFSFPAWSPPAQRAIAFIQNRKPDPEDHSDHNEHNDHGQDDTTAETLKLTDAARKNIGLETGVIELSDFVKKVSVPAMVVERPGRSQIQITAPITGVVTQVFPVERQVIKPGTPLFELRLTHEDLVGAQSELLKSLQVRDVAMQELDRLSKIGKDVIPGKRIVEQRYRLDTANATLAAMRQSLYLHGLSAEQVDAIAQTRTVLTNVMVTAPPLEVESLHVGDQHHYHVQSIEVNRGQSVNAGHLLGVLADHCLLYVEGRAFEDDANRLVNAVNQGTTIRVLPMSGKRNSGDALELPVQSVSDQIDPGSRALKFYLLLKNAPLQNQSLDQSSHDFATNRRFVAWKFRPGQRMEAQIPTESAMKAKIVLPASAVVIDGPNAFVFEQNGNSFDRLDVQVLYRDKNQVVLENDGMLVGSTIATQGAYRMHLALKNQSGGGIDPHAGHSH